MERNPNNGVEGEKGYSRMLINCLNNISSRRNIRIIKMRERVCINEYSGNNIRERWNLISLRLRSSLFNLRVRPEICHAKRPSTAFETPTLEILGPPDNYKIGACSRIPWFPVLQQFVNQYEITGSVEWS